jgi:hypothetical protein
MLVSDVSADIADAGRLAQAPDPAPTPTVLPTSAGAVIRAPFGGMSVGVKWALGLGIAVSVIWFLSLLGNSPSPVRVDAPTARPSPVPSARAAAPPDEFAAKPPVGQGLVLDIPQLRYCLAEEIRLGTISPLVNTYATSEVDRFNARVSDYNSRCARFKYKSGTLEQVRGEIEAQRASIESVARLQWEAER